MTSARCTNCLTSLATCRRSRSDLSFSEFVAQRGFKPEAVAWATNYVEGFNAADADRISIRSLRNSRRPKMRFRETVYSAWWKAMRGFRSFCCAGSWRRAASWFASTPVRTIAWKPGWVEVATVDRSRLPGCRGNRYLASGRAAGEKRRVCAPTGRDSRRGGPARHGDGRARGLRVRPRLLVTFRQPGRGELFLRSRCHSAYLVDHLPQDRVRC